MYQNITTQNTDGTLIITINRPEKLNALNIQTFSELKACFENVYTDASIKAVIITGSGEKAFVAGADIAEFAPFTPAQGEKLSGDGQKVLLMIEHCPKPVLAAVNGFALGGGCELAMACHIRICSENAKFGQPEVNLGVIPGYGGTQRLIQLIGKGKAVELLMTADMIGAEDALRLGLVTHLVKKEELMNKAHEIINKVRSKSPMAIARLVECINAYFQVGVNGLEFETKNFGKCCATPDFIEGTTAFIEKRKANFPGN